MTRVRPKADASSISIRSLAESLGVNRMYLSGLIDGLGISTVRGPNNSKGVGNADVPQIRARINRLTTVVHG